MQKLQINAATATNVNLIKNMFYNQKPQIEQFDRERERKQDTSHNT